MSTATIRRTPTYPFRHLLANALRTVRVVATTAFDVILLGRVDPREPR